MLIPRLCIVGLVAIGLAGCQQHSASPAPQQGIAIAAGEIGSRLPEFSLRDLQGRQFSSTDLRGKVVLIDFWATWCGPCKKEMPGYQQLLDRFGTRGFVVIGFKLDTMKDAEDPLLFAKRLGVRYPLVLATEGVREKFGGIEGLPTTLVYDRQGILRNKIIGFEYTTTFEGYLKQML
ncbi:MAG TPA: TlpA disulfide reductase family protein [Candidatus Angelobacter sp.]|nr:TlpA disulfide reductase family protein [Candidatus Angelobacter sp.]